MAVLLASPSSEINANGIQQDSYPDSESFLFSRIDLCFQEFVAEPSRNLLEKLLGPKSYSTTKNIANTSDCKRHAIATQSCLKYRALRSR